MSAPGRSTCSHGTMHDHSREIDRSMLPKVAAGTTRPARALGLVRLWTCSDCGREGIWTTRWSYYGKLECLDCFATAIDRVSCGCKPQKGRPS